jgi:hypothetical protein
VECGHGSEGLLGVAAAGRAEVGDDPPADPRGVHPRADPVDATCDLAARGHGQVGHRVGPAGLARADRRVDQVDPGGVHRDADLPLARLEVGHLLVREGLGATEVVLADRVHGGSPVRARERRARPALRRYDLEFA